MVLFKCEYMYSFKACFDQWVDRRIQGAVCLEKDKKERILVKLNGVSA